MKDEELALACRVGVPADDALRAALTADTTEYADTGVLEASRLSRLYSRRTRHLGRRGLLLVDEAATLSDLGQLGTEAEARAVSRIQLHEGQRIIYTALLAGTPLTVHACLVHRLPAEKAVPVQ